MSIIETILDRIDELNKATTAYNAGHPIMTDKEWDEKYFLLQEMEKTWGIVYAHSPTQTIHYETKDILTKVRHNHEMLSLEKTKEIPVIEKFFDGHAAVAMCKMDGLTCTLTYENGELVGAETRGDGIIGEDVLHNVKTIPTIPIHIPNKGNVIVDGEIICDIHTFNEHFADMYENPRNFAAGSIRLLSSEESAARKLTFVAWDPIDGITGNSFISRLQNLEELGFTVVPYFHYYNDGDTEALIYKLKYQAERAGYPIDGIVFKFDDVAYGKSLGKTSHHFKNAMAYKFFDEVYKTSLKDIEWTMGRTGVLTPVAVVEPIEIEGTTVERASLHNISIMHDIFHGTPFVNQEVEIFKANMIIPQIYDAEDLSDFLHYPELPFIDIPKKCPVCGGEVQQHTENDSTVLICMNPNCDGKLINRIDHYCGKKGLDIKGLSKMTISKLIDNGWLCNYEELYSLSNFRDEWIKMPGFGERSVDKILNAIESSRECELEKFIAALGIPLIGTSASKELVKYFDTWDKFYEAATYKFDFYNLPNFGVEMHSSIVNFDYEEANRIAQHYLQFKTVEEQQILNDLTGLTFVITGKLHNYKNRTELTNEITSRGGKVVSAISSKTNYLINNDINSTSSKNKTAQQMNIPIITEEQFGELIGNI